MLTFSYCLYTERVIHCYDHLHTGSEEIPFSCYPNIREQGQIVHFLFCVKMHLKAQPNFTTTTTEGLKIFRQNFRMHFK